MRLLMLCCCVAGPGLRTRNAVYGRDMRAGTYLIDLPFRYFGFEKSFPASRCGDYRFAATPLCLVGLIWALFFLLLLFLFLNAGSSYDCFRCPFCYAAAGP